VLAAAPVSGHSQVLMRRAGLAPLGPFVRVAGRTIFGYIEIGNRPTRECCRGADQGHGTAEQHIRKPFGQKVCDTVRIERRSVGEQDHECNQRGETGV
jgi:hypothetical protein